MKPFSKLLALVIAVMPVAAFAAGEYPICPSELAPISTVPPDLPPRLHNEFSGKVMVSFLITPAGKVASPSIVSEEWHPVGRSKSQPVGYGEAIIAAVAQWRYPPPPHTCRHQVPVEVQFSSAASVSSDDRPNIAFKPKLGRYANNMAGRACHVVSYALQFGLT